MSRRLLLGLSIVMVMVLFFGCSVMASSKVYFASTQLHPVEEREFMVGTLLKEFTKETGIEVEFIPLTYNEMLTRVMAEQESKKVKLSLIGDLHGGIDVARARDLIEPIKDISLPKRTFIPSLEAYSVIDGKKYYVPWMQATYVMVVNKEAYKYLPKGLTADDVRNASSKWTYDALLNWAKNMQEKTGSPKFGLPMAPKGLFHRFLHGYLLPSFTGYQAKEFASKRGIAAWEYMKKLSKYIHPASSTWSAMSEPLSKGEVLLAWDHTARIKSAIVQAPEKFEVVPVPRGPAGRGYIIVAAGLAVPKNAPAKAEAYKLIEYLTRPEIQVKILEKVGFFPTVKEATGAIPEGALKVLAQGVIAQSSAKDSIIVMIPNLGKLGGKFTNTYREVFRSVVINKKNVKAEVDKAYKTLKTIFEKAGQPMK